MPIDVLHKAVRDAFRGAMKRIGNQRLAFEESVILLKQHRPEWLEVDIRKAVARMLAEEPGP